MRAVIIATGAGPGVAPLDERYPVPLLPLVGSPFLQHVVEILADQGVTRFDWILSHFPEKIEAFLGDGARWGSRFTFHLARNPERPYQLLKAMTFDGPEREPVLLGHADRLPQLLLEKAANVHPGAPLILFCSRKAAAEDPWQWTGWSLLSPEQMAVLPGNTEESGLQAYLLGTAGGERAYVEVPPPLCVQTPSALLASHQTVLNKEFSGLHLRVRESAPGIWISRNVLLHPTVRLLPPVFIGENSQIGAGVQLGPHASVGHDCVLDTHCAVAQSVIFPGSYVGEALELADVIVDKNCLINVRYGGALTVVDDFILGSLSDRPLLGWLTRLVARLTALLCLVAAGPVLLVTALWLKIARPGKVLYRKEVVRLPVSSEERSWRTFALWSFHPAAETEPGTDRQNSCTVRDFLLRFLPALVNIAKGDLSFVGVPPRTREEIKKLPRDWRSLYLHTKAGIVTEASVRYGTNPTDDELYAAEGHYAVTAGWAQDLKLLLRYFRRVAFGRRLLWREEAP